MKDKLIHKLKEYIRHCDRIIGNWEQSNITLTKLRREIAALEKQIAASVITTQDLKEIDENESDNKK